MKIVIVENPRPLTAEHYNDVANAPLSASLNSGYALAVSRLAGWDSAHLDFTATLQSVDEVAALVLAEDADIILFHWVYSWGHEAFVRSILELLRQNSAAAIGAFGLFPTLADSRLLQFAPHLDFILAGEFEDTLAELLALFRGRQTLAALPGVVLRSGPFVPRPLLADLSRLPMPDDVGANCGYPALNIAASRGCSGECSFCFIHRYYGCSLRRVRGLASLERELEVRLARRAVNSLYFIDPTFIGQGERERGRAVEMSCMADQHGLPFGFETRVDSIEEKTIAKLAAHGACSIFLGIESGCNSVLQRIGKRITTEQIRHAVGIVRGSGIELNLGFIMFEPDSTLSELEENYRFLESLDLLDGHELTANLLYHNQIVLYGSSAWRRFEREGRLLLDEHLPFESRYRFRDERVGAVCAAMGRITSCYFRCLSTLRQTRPDAVPTAASAVGTYLNEKLKSAFLSLCSAAHTQRGWHVVRAEEEILEQIVFCFSPAAPYGT